MELYALQVIIQLYNKPFYEFVQHFGRPRNRQHPQALVAGILSKYYDQQKRFLRTCTDGE